MEVPSECPPPAHRGHETPSRFRRAARLVQVLAVSVLGACGGPHGRPANRLPRPSSGDTAAARLTSLIRRGYTDPNPTAVYRQISCEIYRLQTGPDSGRAEALVEQAQRDAMNPAPSEAARQRVADAMAAAMITVGCE